MCLMVKTILSLVMLDSITRIRLHIPSLWDSIRKPLVAVILFIIKIHLNLSFRPHREELYVLSLSVSVSIIH